MIIATPRSTLTVATFLAIVLAQLPATACRADEHWAFRPVLRQAPPAVARGDWSRNGIDPFILARLEQEGLGPSSEADRVTLIRRVTLDLIGLPPTIAEVDAFVNDARPQAYEELVNRLLASPHYGERWARPWLDACHYGDSDGHLTDQLRPVAWRYRDWVVQALNANMPFDEFTVLQLAGDLVPAATQDQVLGTGFLRQTLSNREGGADLEEYRVAQVLDRTSMVGTIWLGLTVGCARCHDHKYDPISQEEFYRVYAYFDNADEVNIDAPLPHERETWLRTRPEYERRRRELVAPVKDALADLQKRWEEKCLHAAAHPGEDHVWDRQWELLGLIWGGHLGEGQLEGTGIAKLPWDKRTPRMQDDLLDYFLQHGAIVDAKKFEELKLADLRKQLVALKQEFPPPTRAPVMRASLNPRKTYIHERGEFRDHGRVVDPGTPDCLPPMSSDSKDPPRLALARWLVSASNPLTPRVTVNRIWQEFFGRGIVFTSNNFGVRGDRPSHPELLDWLAAEFVRSGWDVKHIHRLIVSSATYRQSSQPRPGIAARDPHNVLLSRQSNLRVPAETVRDMALAVSGKLSTTLGGPGVRPPQHERVVMEAFGANDWKVSDGADRYRRGLYTFVLRTSPFAQAITFDAPAPVETCTRRIRSNTPLQALTLLNDPMFFELAETFAGRILADGGVTDRQRIEHAVRLCLARSPSDAERERLQAYLDRQRAAFASDLPRADLPVQNDAARAVKPDVAAWTNLASVLLNLHEFITRD